MKATLLITIIILTTSLAYSQNISLSTITTAGGYVTNDKGISVSWSIGQVFSLTTQSDQHVTEGFQQGKLDATGKIILNATRKNASTVFLQLNKKGSFDTKQFSLQRRHANEQSFVTIATINNSDNSILTYFDNNNSEKNTEYRILFTNHRINKISNLATVEGTPRILNMTIFPNPTVEYLNIKLSNSTDKMIIVNIWDVNGKNVFSNKYQIIDNQIINIPNLDELSKGSYIVQATNGTEIIGSQPFVKL